MTLYECFLLYIQNCRTTDIKCKKLLCALNTGYQTPKEEFLMQEEWRDIVIEKNGIVYDYSGLYQVSNLGRVKTLGKGKTQKQEKLFVLKQDKYLGVSKMLKHG